MYPEGPTIGVKFAGTERLPRSSGEAKVERKKGMTEIEVELDEMKSATLFGGDVSTYVLWIASPEGHVDNAGEFILEGNRSKLDVSTPLQTFGMFITAEPHFLVDTPSRLVVMENTRPTENVSGQMLKVSNIQYRGFDGIYNHDHESLADMPEPKGEVRSDSKQARVAVDLAERAGAERFANDELQKAKGALQEMFASVESGVGKRIVMTQAHDTVRLAVEARKLAQERAFQAALDAERQEHQEEQARLKQSIEQAQSEAERARLQAQQKEMQLNLEEQAKQRVQTQLAEASRRAAEQERLRQQAEQESWQARQQALQANQRADQLAAEKSQAEQDAERARQEREAARQRLQEALGKVVETRQTARGVIVNLPDILFDFDKATLKPQAREVLSRVCGILTVVDGYDLSVEGYTDAVGSDEYNQKLSERRAGSVQNYLGSCDLSGVDITAKGLGESRPVASNDTPAGRQKNRRVEIVIEDNEQFQVGMAGASSTSAMSQAGDGYQPASQ